MRLALLTPDPADETYASRWRDAYEQYRIAFAAAGVETIAAPWVDPWPADVDAIVPVRAWGYHKRAMLWAERLADPPAPLINPAHLLRWNTDKTYLGALAELGVPIAPTVFTAALEQETLDKAFARFVCEQMVVKPAISAGSYHTRLLSKGDAAPDVPGLVMLQPYLDAVQGEGELSLFYFGGALSHAVRKVAVGGDFRVQPQFGGQVEAIVPTGEMRALAEQTLAAAPDGLVYARIDLIRGTDGELKLMEMEAIEPDLYLGYSEGAVGRFVRAVLAAV
jgi:glutathione synthase/RimK-type ligase-like ATP-grasp enzyme